MAKTRNNSVSIAVAIVEDDVPAREILAGWIRSAEGFRIVGEYTDAETAISELPQKKPSVVLFDINLPGMSGIECVRKLKPRLPDTQFLMVTVYEDANHIFNALSAGASGLRWGGWDPGASCCYQRGRASGLGCGFPEGFLLLSPSGGRLAWGRWGSSAPSASCAAGVAGTGLQWSVCRDYRGKRSTEAGVGRELGV